MYALHLDEAGSSLGTEVTCGKKVEPPKETLMSVNCVTGSFSMSNVTRSPELVANMSRREHKHVAGVTQRLRSFSNFFPSRRSEPLSPSRPPQRSKMLQLME